MELNNPVVVEQVRRSSDRYETAPADSDTRTGRQMQAWIRFDEGWKILAAPISLMAARLKTEQPAL